MTEADWYLIDAVRLVALREVFNGRRPEPKDGDPYYPLRRIFRAYSEAFNTPLHEVECLPLSDVVQHHFEHLFEQLSDDDLKEAVAKTVEDLDRLIEAQKKEDVRDYESYLDGRMIAAEEAVKKIEAAKNSLQKAVAQQASRARPTLADRREAELTPSKPAPIPEGFTMQFDDGPEDDGPSVGFGLFERDK